LRGYRKNTLEGLKLQSAEDTNPFHGIDAGKYSYPVLADMDSDGAFWKNQTQNPWFFRIPAPSDIKPLPKTQKFVSPRK
jgi:hypothetical protein